MTYNEIYNLAKQGKVGMLPNFIGYFKWSYELNDLVFINNNFSCLAKDLQIQDRTDFYYII